jgi:DNA-directed RNA polymerase III subunit RPC6
VQYRCLQACADLSQSNPLLSDDSDLKDMNDPVDDDKIDKKKKKRKRYATSSSSASSSSDSDSDDSDSDSDTGSSVSSVDSEDIDLDEYMPKSSKPKSGAKTDADTAEPAITSLEDREVVYRAIKRITIPLGQVQAPCGQCPVFAFCEEGGPVDPVGCKYYGDWLMDIVGGWDREGLEKFRGDKEDGVDVLDEEGVDEKGGDLVGEKADVVHSDDA